MGSQLRYAASVAWQNVAGQVVVVDLARRRALAFNSTGSFVWERLEVHPPGDIAASLAERWRLDPGRAAADVETFVSDVIGRGLVERVK